MRKFWQWNISNTPAYWFAQGNYGKGLKVWVKGILIMYGVLALLGGVLSILEKEDKKRRNDETARRLINEAFNDKESI